MYTLKVAIRSLVEFVLRSGDLVKSGSSPTQLTRAIKAHVDVQQNQENSEYKPEVHLSYPVIQEDITLIISGRADGIYPRGEDWVVDEIKTTMLPLEKITENYNPLHWAQAQCYAFIFATQNQKLTMWVQLTYYQLDTKALKKFIRLYTYEELQQFFDHLVTQYLYWERLRMAWIKKRNTSIQQLSFPFPTYRQGQKKLMFAVYEAIRLKKKLFAQAPTGIGKTLATLFPTLKAMGEGKLDKIFYLTAKTTARSVAEKAFEKMRENGLACKSVTITAKEKTCFYSPCNMQECEYTLGYFDRINGAIEAIWKEPYFSQETIEKYAREYRVCPFEFSLELALWADCVICDYNYVFDPRVYLRRFFLDVQENYSFLIDEAHNLVDRARSMFSAELFKTAILQQKKETKTTHPKISKALNAINTYFIQLRKKCLENQNIWTQKELPQDLYPLLEKFTEAMEMTLEQEKIQTLHEDLLDLYFSVLAFFRVAEFYDERFITYVENSSQDVKIKLFCLDPSELLKKALKRGKSGTLFSATLSPLPYFREILGGIETDLQTSIPSPFSPKNLLLGVIPSIHTTFRKREGSYQKIANYILSFMQQKIGNYLVFFPSYQYMQSVLSCLSTQEEDHYTLLIQTSEMGEAERQSFLAHFEENPKKSLIGFAVLGGIFSEAVDLEGERLSGAIIVGVGLPQVCLERNLIRSHFQEKKGAGFEYGYIYPGMNKVLQAAGRVIRTDTDQGVVLLLDQRFQEASYFQLFPTHWQHAQVFQDMETMTTQVLSFWQKKDSQTLPTPQI